MAHGKESTCSSGDTGDKSLIPGSERSSEEGNGNLLQDSCLDRAIWKAAVHGVTKSRTRPSTHTHTQGRSEVSWLVSENFIGQEKQSGKEALLDSVSIPEAISWIRVSSPQPETHVNGTDFCISRVWVRVSLLIGWVSD